MKILTLSVSLLLLLSCKNSPHNGVYVTGLGVTQSPTNEVLRIEGDQIIDLKYSWGGEFVGETKISCRQFPDRIEYEELGLTKVLRVLEDHSLKIADEVTFVRFGNLSDSFFVNGKGPKPLIKVNEGTINILPEKNPEDGSLTPASIKMKKLDDGTSYQYVTYISTNPREPFFQGEKSFVGYIDDVYIVRISGDNIEIKEPANMDNILLTGKIKNGRIVDQYGKDSRFIYKAGALFRKVAEKQWLIFFPLKN